MKAYLTILILLFLFTLACIFFGCQREYLIGETKNVDKVDLYTKDQVHIVIHDVDKVQRWYKTGTLEQDQDFWIIIFENQEEQKIYWKDVYKFEIILE